MDAASQGESDIFDPSSSQGAARLAGYWLLAGWLSASQTGSQQGNSQSAIQQLKSCNCTNFLNIINVEAAKLCNCTKKTIKPILRAIGAGWPPWPPIALRICLILVFLYSYTVWQPQHWFY